MFLCLPQLDLFKAQPLHRVSGVTLRPSCTTPLKVKWPHYKLTSWNKKDFLLVVSKFPDRSTFLGPQARTSGGRWNPPSADNGQRANGFLRLRQSHRKAEMLQRCFSKKSSPGKTLPLSLGGNGFKDWLLFLWKMVKNLREKPQNPLLLLKPQKLIKFF